MNLHKTLFSCILITILIWLGKTASAQQNYPVLATLQLNAPYSLYLSDYTTPGTDKMQVNIFLKDLTKSNYPCRLRLRIEGFGMSIQSKNDFYVSPVYLSGGEMRMLSGADLVPYLQPSNLIFQGLDMGNFNRNGGKLPEGVYRFSIEVLDYYNRKVVSNTAGSVLSVFLSYPPIINIPSQNTTVRVLEPQNVMFQWVPRHTGSVNAAYHVAYKFRLVELIPTTRDANDAIRTSRPLYETFTDQTYLVYGPSEPTLTPGSNYAVQVQAVEAEGRDIFINNGNSEVIKFTYGEKCSVPSNIVAELDRHNSIKLSWMPLPMQQVFSVRYREAGHRNAEWFEQEVYLPKHILQGLRPGKTYEYQVRAQCTYGYGEYSDLQQFKLPDEQMRSGDFVCGKPETIAVAERSDLLTSISPGTVFMAGSFPVTVTDAIAVSGRISGKGTVGVPYLNQLNFNVEFDDILINSELQLVGGKVSLSHQALDQSQEELLASVTVKPDANGQVQIGTQNGLPAIIDAAIGPEVAMQYEASTKTITIPVKTAEGKNLTIKVSGDLPQVFQDKEGETYEIDEQGKVVYKGKIATKEFLAGGSLSNPVLDNIKAEVAFSAPNQKYGLDNFQAKHEDQSRYIKDYQKLKADKGDVYIGWKSVETGKTDEVEADVKLIDNSLDINKIEFRTGSGEKISSSQKGNKFTFSIIGSSEGNEKEIYAFYPTKTDDSKGYNFAKLNIASYKKIHKKAVIVPVNGAGAELDTEELENYLNKIYQAAVVAWDVEKAPDFRADTFSWDIDKDGHLEAGNSSALSAYTTEQKKLAGLYKSQEGLKDNTYYIFLIKGFSKSDQEGYMVRSGQVGFVVANSSVKHTIAHELGHGTFNLPHTWDEYGIKQNSSNNLMDYSGGEELWYSQWNYLRNPDWVFRAFEGDDEGAYLAGSFVKWEGFLPFEPEDNIILSKGARAHFIESVSYKQDKVGRYNITINGKTELYSALNDAITGQFRGFYPVSKLTNTDKNSENNIYRNLDRSYYLDTKYYSVTYSYNQDHSQSFWNAIAKRKDIDQRSATEIALLLESMSPEMYADYIQIDQKANKSHCKYLDINNTVFNYSKCWEEIIKGLRLFINGKADANQELLAAIKNNPLDEEDIKIKFRNLKNGNYNTFTASERQILLSYLATRPVMNGDWWNKENEESFAIHVIENTPNDQIKDVLSILQQPPLDPLKQLYPKYFNKPLIYILDDRITDGVLGSSLGGDNNTKAKLCLCNLVFKSNSSTNVITTTNPETTPLIKDCYINLFQAENANVVQETIFKLKEAADHNSSLLVKDLPLPLNFLELKRVEKVDFGGNDYQFIQLEYEPKSVSNQNPVTVNGHIEKTIRTTLYGKALYGIVIDNRIDLFVGSEQEQDNLYNYILNPINLKGNTILLFVNGYRSNLTPGFEKAPIEEIISSTNVLSRIDPFSYWSGIDKNFIERLNTNNVWYADGHASITTSNHKTWGGSATGQFGFIGNMIHSEGASNFAYATISLHPDWYHNFDKTLTLHTEPNIEGFNARRQNGKIAGEDFVRKIKDGSINVSRDGEGNITSKLDIVAHSMGYAYSLGILDALRTSEIRIPFGRFYIIAPENACSGQVDLTAFEEVWQYGSNLGQPDEDPLWEQDGVAPQCAVQGLSNPTTTRGRIYIPKEWTPKGFVDSHKISNYGWIFKQKSGDPGYVKER